MSSGSLPIRYTKVLTKITDQVAQLRKRGLVVNDAEAVERFLGHVNYYRLSGYCRAFENARHQFVAGTSFESIYAAYQFDTTLRDLFTESLELIEIDIRSAIAYSFGLRYGAFGHASAANFHKRFDHATWIDRLRTETKRSSELFVNHFRTRYREFPDIPIWAAVEVMSFGGLSRMISGLWKHDRQMVAASYGVNAKELSSIAHHFVYVRNLCAHHSRLWDRTWTVKPDLPNNPNWTTPPVSNRHLWGTLLLFRLFLNRSPSLAATRQTWKHRVDALMISPPAVHDPLQRMGMPPNWHDHQIWKS